ncbi:phosphate ABC transporter permease PstA [Crassaminicella thermophila]|uniref:Phosphate transport system permease protein PstA n=1 Tax=Crassaminicella thermophila TaxID=2599308 RepID=A0A5C0SFD7_CRATE|nr:phosphate ABC transporter permease PstA [Crassaminicella thermophila]QEK11968.1 phosphate ABC transporter permease PstA [Crassaminicella thermophila]
MVANTKFYTEKLIKRGSKRKINIKEKIVYYWIYLVATLTILALLSIIGYVLINGAKHVNLDFFIQEPKSMGRKGGIFSIIVGTIYLTLVSIAIATPIGVSAAIYLTEYAKENKFIKIIRFGTETLAGIPSIIFGLFGFVFFVIFLGFRWSILSGGLTLALMILPTLIRATEEAIKTVPKSYREGSLALGATKWQTIVKVVLPSSIPGILTGLILGVGRAIGETAAVMLTAGSSLGVPESIMDPARTMSVHLYLLASEGLSQEKTFATASVLIILVLFINFLANMVGNRYMKNTKASA